MYNKGGTSGPKSVKTQFNCNKTGEMSMGTKLPHLQNAEEDWDGEHQKQLQQSDVQQKWPPQVWDTKQVQDPQCNMNYQIPQSQHSQISLNVPDWHAEQIHLRKECEKRMEQLNDKYGLNYFSDFELGSESDEEERYQYKHKYEMLI